MHRRHFLQKNQGKCLTKLPKQNIITKINDSFHFTIINPMIIKTKCNNNEFYIKFIKNTRIINRECYLSNSFFEYDPYKGYKTYQIFRPIFNNSNPSIDKFCENENLNMINAKLTESNELEPHKNISKIRNYNILITIACLAIATTIYTLIVGYAFLRYSRKIYTVNAREQNYHDYESIDEYV